MDPLEALGVQEFPGRVTSLAFHERSTTSFVTIDDSQYGIACLLYIKNADAERYEPLRAPEGFKFHDHITVSPERDQAYIAAIPYSNVGGSIAIVSVVNQEVVIVNPIAAPGDPFPRSWVRQILGLSIDPNAIIVQAGFAPILQDRSFVVVYRICRMDLTNGRLTYLRDMITPFG
jgi:hypothetical protein